MKALLFIVIASAISVFGQGPKVRSIDGIFAGKIGVTDKTVGNYTVEELKKCDWTIVVADADYTVKEFKMSLVFRDGTPSQTFYHGFACHEIKGSSIPEKYREIILNETTKVYLEFIRAVNDRGVSITVNPITIRIQP